MNDVYDILPPSYRDKKLALVYETNKINLVAVNTPVGLTDRFSVNDIVQQGGGWGPIECSVSIDKLGRGCFKNRKFLYRFKDKVNILPLAMIDDLLAVAKCGLESLAINTYINVHIELKKLRFHVPDSNKRSKCHKIHIGKPNPFCPMLKVHGNEMPTSTNEAYLGDIISSDGRNKVNLDDHKTKGIGKSAEILCIVNRISLGRHFFKIALALRESLFLSSILTNSEVWYNLSEADLNDINLLDRKLLARIYVHY